MNQSGVVNIPDNGVPEFRVQFRGRLCSPMWHERGPAWAYLRALLRGSRKPEFAVLDDQEVAA